MFPNYLTWLKSSTEFLLSTILHMYLQASFWTRFRCSNSFRTSSMIGWAVVPGNGSQTLTWKSFSNLHHTVWYKFHGLINTLACRVYLVRRLEMNYSSSEKIFLFSSKSTNLTYTRYGLACIGWGLDFISKVIFAFFSQY